MVKRFFTISLIATVLTLAFPLSVRADVVSEPGFFSGRNSGILVHVIGLVIIVAVVTVLLTRFLKKRNGRK